MLIKNNVISTLLGMMIFIIISGCNNNEKDIKPNTAADNKVVEEKISENKVVTKFDKDSMQIAIEKAQSEVEKFIAIIKKDSTLLFAVKVPIQDGNKIEHFWLREVRIIGDNFIGKIDNQPEYVTNVVLNQAVSINKKDISDWYYIKNKIMYGNYTLRVLWKDLSEKERNELSKQFTLSPR